MPPSDPPSEGAPGSAPAATPDLDQGTLGHASRRLLQRSRVFLDASHPILLQDSEGRVIDADDQAVESLGWTREELIGRPFEDAFAPDWREALQTLVDRCRAGEEIREEESVLRTRQDECIPVVLSLSLVPAESQRSHAIAATAREVRKNGREEERVVAAADEARQDARRTLGSALHDSIGQLLPLARMKLAELREEVAAPLRGRVDEVDRLLSDAETRARTLMFQLDPAVLHDLGIAAAARRLADELHEHYGLRVSVDDDDVRKPLSEAQRTALFRGLREVLVNVARHAGTEVAKVQIARDARWVWLIVEDDGPGFEPSTRGFGLRSVEERLQRMGGRFEVDSAPAAGVRVRLAVPISAQCSSDEAAAE